MPVTVELSCLTTIPTELERVFLPFSNTYTVALRSVVLPSVPSSPQYIRSEVICAGFLIQAVDSNSCTVTYLNQMSDSILPYFAGNIGGWSKSIEEAAASCIKFIENATPDGLKSVL